MDRAQGDADGVVEIDEATVRLDGDGQIGRAHV